MDKGGKSQGLFGVYRTLIRANTKSFVESDGENNLLLLQLPSCLPKFLVLIHFPQKENVRNSGPPVPMHWGVKIIIRVAVIT